MPGRFISLREGSGGNGTLKPRDCHLDALHRWLSVIRCKTSLGQTGVLRPPIADLPLWPGPRGAAAGGIPLPAGEFPECAPHSPGGSASRSVVPAQPDEDGLCFALRRIRRDSNAFQLDTAT